MDGKEIDLISAIGKSDLTTVKKLLSQGVAIDSLVLQEVASCQNLEIVRAILEKIPNLDRQQSDMSTPLQTAVECNSPEVVKLFLDKRANPNLYNRGNGKTILFSAIERGDTTILRLLLDYGLNVDEPIYRTGIYRIRERDSRGFRTLNGERTQEINRIKTLPPEAYARERGLTEIATMIEEHRKSKEQKASYDSSTIVTEGCISEGTDCTNRTSWVGSIFGKSPSSKQR